MFNENKSQIINLICCLKNGEPPSKAKYWYMRDSALVLWRKDEIDTGAGVKRGKIII